MRHLLLCLPLLFATSASGHDVWMQTDRFDVPVGTDVAYRVYSGHGTSREPWNVGPARVVSLRSIGAKGTVVIKPARTSEGTIRFSRTGSYIVTMESNSALSDLPAVRFLDYAKDEGLTPIIALREKTGATARNGREQYSRRTKMLVRVGNPAAQQTHFTLPVGLTLELVPARDPFVIPNGQPLPMRVLYQGRPLAGATVKLTNLDADEKPVARIITNAAGIAVFRHPGKGRWQFNTIWSQPIAGNADADFDTVFSSLTFGR